MWDVIPSIKSPYTLAAFIAAVVATILWRLIDRQRRLIVSAPEKQRAELVRSALEFFQVDTKNLSRTQQYDLALQQIRQRAHRFLAVMLAAVFALLICAIVVMQNIDAESSRDNARVRSEIAAAIAQAGEKYPQLITALRETRAQLAASVDRLSKLPMNDPDRAALQALIQRSRNQVAQIQSEAHDISAAVEQLTRQGSVEPELGNQVDALRSQRNVFDDELSATNSQLDRTSELVAAAPRDTTGTAPAPSSQTENPFLPTSEPATQTQRAGVGLQSPVPATPTRTPAPAVPEPPTNVSVQ